MLNFTVDLASEKQTITMARDLAKCLTPPLLITFCGEIGAGKTTFVRAMLQALGVQGAIKSPTFSIVESYSVSDWQFHHFDLYRLNDEMELDYIGFRDYFTPHTICCIEWPERAGRYLEKTDIAITLSGSGLERKIQCSAGSGAGRAILQRLKREL